MFVTLEFGLAGWVFMHGDGKRHTWESSGNDVWGVGWSDQTVQDSGAGNSQVNKSPSME